VVDGIENEAAVEEDEDELSCERSDACVWGYPRYARYARVVL
jgi:hypothetical protein